MRLRARAKQIAGAADRALPHMSQHLSKPLDRLLTRRSLLRYGGSLSATVAGMSTIGGLLRSTSAAASSAIRAPDSLPDPTRPAGTATESLPFEHIVVVMMENHSFDNLLGALALVGPAARPRTDASTRAGVPLNSNPGPDGSQCASFAFPTTAQGPHVSQTWSATHEQIDGGKMDGFVRSVDADQPMGYWTQDVLPFAYSLARTFTVANRWFCSAPCQTYPNRRFLMAGTAYGEHRDRQRKPATIRLRQTARSSIACTPTASAGATTSPTCPRPASSRRSSRNTRRTWRRSRQFSPTARPARCPRSASSTPSSAPLRHRLLAGTVPACEHRRKLRRTGGDEENPQDMSYGESWAY